MSSEADLKVVTVAPDGRGTKVVIQAASSEEATSGAAAQAAVAAANIPKGSIRNTPRAYPVDAEGNTSDDLMFGRSGTAVAGYRCDFVVAPGL